MNLWGPWFVFLAIMAAALIFLLGWKCGARWARWHAAVLHAIRSKDPAIDEAASAYIERGPLGNHAIPTLH